MTFVPSCALPSPRNLRQLVPIEGADCRNLVRDPSRLALCDRGRPPRSPVVAGGPPPVPSRRSRSALGVDPGPRPMTAGVARRSGGARNARPLCTNRTGMATGRDDGQPSEAMTLSAFRSIRSNCSLVRLPSLRVLASESLGADGMATVGHGVVAGLLAGFRRPSLLGQPELSRRQLRSLGRREL